MQPNSQPRYGGIFNRIVLAFVLLTCFRVWVGPMAFERTADARIPDSGLQRRQILDEARRTNELLAQIKQVLQVGTLNVRLQGADNQAGKPARKRGGG